MERPLKAKRAQKESEATGCDYISSLPDDLLGAIVTYLPIKEGARTAVLSPRWHHIWAQSLLNLDVGDLWDAQVRRGSRYVAKLFAPLARHNGPVRNLCIKEGLLPPRGRASRDRWFRILGKKTVQQLIYTGFDDYSNTNLSTLPLSLISHSLLSVLQLSFVRLPDRAVLLPCLLNLRMLKLDRLRVSDKVGPIDIVGASFEGGGYRRQLVYNPACARSIEILEKDFRAIISGLPLLLSLDLSYFKSTCDLHVHSKTLEILQFYNSALDCSLSLGVPNLKVLKIAAIVQSISYEDISHMVSNLPMLESLELLSVKGDEFKIQS